MRLKGNGHTAGIKACFHAEGNQAGVDIQYVFHVQVVVDVPEPKVSDKGS